MHRSSPAALALIVATAPSQAQSPSTENLGQRAIERRTVETVIWGMPAVDVELMLQFALAARRGAQPRSGLPAL